MSFRWFTRLLPTILSSTTVLSDDDMFIFFQPPQPGRLITTILLNNTMPPLDSLWEGLGNIHVEKVEYRKSYSPGNPLGHEYLVVTVKESIGARRSGHLLVDWIGRGRPRAKTTTDTNTTLSTPPSSNDSSDTAEDDAQATPPTSAPATRATRATPANQWETINRFHHAIARIKNFRKRIENFSKWDPVDVFDKLIILNTIDEAFDVQGRYPYDVLMTMDLSLGQRPITLEHFLLLSKTTTKDTIASPFIYAQCSWFAHTIRTVLQLETGAPIQNVTNLRHRGMMAMGRQAPVRGDDKLKTPETVKVEWEQAKVVADKEWEALRQAFLASERPPTKNVQLAEKH